MNELIQISNAVIGKAESETINARELHAFLGVGRDFSTWLKNRIDQYGFAEGEDYTTAENLSSPNLGSSKSRQQVIIEYHINLDMAKELAMIENNDKGRAVRKYFIACEKELKSKQAKELLRLSNFETLYEKAERDYSEMQHNVYNLYEPMRLELSRMKNDQDLDRKEARDRLIEEKADKKFETWKRQMSKVWAKRFETIKKSLDAIEKRYAKLHKEHDNEISRLVQRALIETTASTDF